MLHDQSGDKHAGDMDLGVGEAKGRKENVRIANIPLDIDEGELLDVCFTYNLSPDYKLIRPSEVMRVTEPLDGDSITMYEESFRSGVRFPLSEPLKSFFNEYNITISRLYPNGLRLLGFGVPNHWSEDPLRHLLASPTPYDRNCVELIEARGLGSVNLRRVIAEGYLTCTLSGPMRPNPSFSSMAPKKTKSSRMAKVSEVMKK
ncbi:hypothetical protein JCGZ_03378 [Jatropha curcas]|uniref:Uncharacterized protein n=1 Tax=Jatropha curcas TaxID=180498 RepID=A0A067JG63_JATCU|nr:hypothetical protein JCGZ_03378 [Jatropha curcas]